MLIKALNDYYDILSSEGRVCPEGMSVQKVSYKIMLRTDGTISDIIDIRRPSAPDKKGKIKLEPVEITVPVRTQKPGIDFNVIEHRPLYIFGLNLNKGELSPDDATGKAKKSHECFAVGNLEFTKGMTSDIVIAYRNFIKNWIPENETQNEMLIGLGKEYSSAYYCFALDGHPDITLHDMDGEIMQKIASMPKDDAESDGICAVSGEEGTIARIHDKIKGVRGGQAAGGLLVCFNSTAEESYGKEQSYNSGISQKTVKRYTQALNCILADPYHRIYVDDLTVAFWAMDKDDKKETNLLMRMLGEESADAEETDAMLLGILTDLKEGRKADLSAFDIDENVMFYIAGLAPNNSRISQKFLYSGKFGKIFGNTAKHQLDLAIDGLKGQVSIKRMFEELKDQKSDKAKTPPSLIAATFGSILGGTKYPDSLLETSIRRVKIEKNVTNIKAGIIKACLNRKIRINKNKEEIKMALDLENKNPAYLCGRLFAVVERVQENSAESELNRTVKDTYFSSACSNPATVFANLIRLSQHHLAKDKYADKNNGLIGEIIGKLQGEFPRTLSLDEQGKFIIGYYHQRQNFFKKNENQTEEKE